MTKRKKNYSFNKFVSGTPSLQSTFVVSELEDLRTYLLRFYLGNAECDENRRYKNDANHTTKVEMKEANNKCILLPMSA